VIAYYIHYQIHDPLHRKLSKLPNLTLSNKAPRPHARNPQSHRNTSTAHISLPPHLTDTTHPTIPRINIPTPLTSRALTMPSRDFAGIENISADDANGCGGGVGRRTDGTIVNEGWVREEWCGVYEGRGKGAGWEGEGWRVWRKELRETWFEILKGREVGGGRGG